jgi:hypothetical protein
VKLVADVCVAEATEVVVLVVVVLGSAMGGASVETAVVVVGRAASAEGKLLIRVHAEVSLP